MLFLLFVAVTSFGHVTAFSPSSSFALAIKSGERPLASRSARKKASNTLMTFASLRKDENLHPSSDSKNMMKIQKNWVSLNNASSILQDYIQAIRPLTVLQAVGALVVGRLALVSGGGATNAPPVGAINSSSPSIQMLAAMASVYLSYGAGMAMNDCADVAADSQHSTKQNRAIAAGRISPRDGWIYCATLSCISLGLGGCYIGGAYAAWTASNLILMLGYALGLQRLFLVKNVLCGWFAISPLVGASLMTAGCGMQGLWSNDTLWRLAGVGFPVHVAREILKDIEDVDIDRDIAEKVTLPLVIGKVWAHRIAYTLVSAVCSTMVFTRTYWRMFASTPPLYTLGVCAGVPMCIRASMLPLKDGEQLLKKSIYVLLAGMIGGLLLQSP